MKYLLLVVIVVATAGSGWLGDGFGGVNADVVEVAETKYTNAEDAVMNTSESFGVLRARLVARFSVTGAQTSAVTSALNVNRTFSANNGTWSDIDYSNKYNFPPVAHLQRISAMAKLYSSPGNVLFQNASIFATMMNALDYWYRVNYINGNWWWNVVGLPLELTPTCLLLQNQLTPARFKSCVDILSRGDPTGYTGANLVWTATVMIYRAVLQQNLTAITSNFNLMYSSIKIMPGDDDGIKADGSFFQHSAISYSGGYGFDFTNYLTSMVVLSDNTTWAMPSSYVDTLALHILDGQQWLIMLPAKVWDISCLGRTFTRQTGPSASAFPSVSPYFSGSRVSEWRAFQARMTGSQPGNLVGNRAFFASDYMIHSRPNYVTSVKMYSSRITNTECGNQEGKRSVHMVDGANFLYLSGLEYSLIFPLWDWELIPGTTVEKGGVPLDCALVQTTSKSNFVGVVSDGMYGGASQDLWGPFTSTLNAKKSWYFFDDEYIALGCNITLKSGRNPINTAIDQRWLNGNVSTSSNATITPGDYTLNNTWWVHHNSIGYIFPEWNNTASNKVTVKINTLAKSSNWNTINTQNISASGSTFSMWLPQRNGTGAIDTYAYIVVPSVNVSNFRAQAPIIRDNIIILSNVAKLQSVYHSKLGILYMTAWRTDVRVMHPVYNVWFTATTTGMYIFSPINSTNSNIGIKITMSDFSQTSKMVTVTIAALRLVCDVCTYNNVTKVTTVSMTSPTGNYLGQSRTFNCYFFNTTTSPTSSPASPSSSSSSTASSSATTAKLTTSSSAATSTTAKITTLSTSTLTTTTTNKPTTSSTSLAISTSTTNKLTSTTTTTAKLTTTTK